MPPRRTRGPLWLGLDRAGDAPLWVRLAQAVRARILAGALGPGARLPSARELAAQLSVSRHTVEAALAELEAEGLLERRAGAGTFVAAASVRDLAPAARRAPRGSLAPSARGQALAAAAAPLLPSPRRAFAPCSTAGDVFPHARWARLLARCARELARGPEASAEGEAQGHLPLRQAIAEHLAQTRGLTCGAEEVLVVRSTQEALLVAAHGLLGPGDEVWMEDPGYGGAVAAFGAAGLEVVPVPVDAQGLVVAEGRRRAPRARLAYLTPACQFPTGVALTPSRRAELLAWAHEAQALVLEDDYDAELRYRGQAPAAVGAEGGRTLPVGTFNKALFPSLRLAYLVAPAEAMAGLVAVRAALGGPPPTLVQATLAAFLEAGELGPHLRRLRQVCEERRDTLRDAVERELGGRLRLEAPDSGQHAVGWLEPGSDDAAVSQRAAAAGLDAPPLSRYALEAEVPPGLVLSFAGATPAELRAGVHTLARCLEGR